MVVTYASAGMPPRCADPVASAAALLGVPPSCDLATLKSAYKKAALLYHPDTGTSMDASTELFQQVGEAFGLLQRHLHEQQWGTSSSTIGAGVEAPPQRITLEK